MTTREQVEAQIVEMIQNEYDPAPDRYYVHDNWNDGAKEMAAKAYDLVRADYLASLSAERDFAELAKELHAVAEIEVPPYARRRWDWRKLAHHVLAREAAAVAKAIEQAAIYHDRHAAECIAARDKHDADSEAYALMEVVRETHELAAIFIRARCGDKL